MRRHSMRHPSPRRLSIARSVAVALLGLTLVLALLAGIAVANLYHARQRYEDRVAAAYSLETAAAKLLAASVVEEATLRLAPGPTGVLQRLRASRAFADAASAARALAADDPASLALVGRVTAQETALRAHPGARAAPLAARSAVVALSARQAVRRTAARATARSDSRRALIALIVAGALAVAAALGLVWVLISRVRGPLLDLLQASRRLAAGDLGARVSPHGPYEVQVLGGSFNAMAEDLAVALDRLEAERRRLDQTVQSLGDALVVVDADGTIASANPRAGELLPALVPGGRVEDVGDALPALDQALGREVTLVRDGLTLAATAARVDEGPDRPGGVVWTVRDVTERARLEQLKSEFVATASHELRSPLTSIKGFVELLEASEQLDPRQREFVEIVLLSTNRLVDLVNDLLDVTRIEAGQAEISPRPTEVSALVREVATLMGPRLRDKGQELELTLPDDVVPALADPARVRQIITNLLTNAHLYTPRDGHVEIRLDQRNGMVSLSVIDDGPGMDEEELERIFDRFYRGAGRARGTGLGLSIVKSLIDLHGGQIQVRSRLGEGSTFTVELPAAVELADVSARAALEGKRVLVVDDEPNVARLIVARLAALGARAVAVHDGPAGLALMRSETFDAVTLDVLMPGMTGFDVLREMRADERLRDVPVVIISVLSAREMLAGEWVVSKPIDTEQLADALGAAVTSDRVRVLVVGRESVRPEMAGALDALAIGHDWAVDAAAAAAHCAHRRFEVALIDSGLPDAAEAMDAIDLRGRRPGRSVIVFTAGGLEPGAMPMEAEPVALQQAVASAVAALGEARPAGAGEDPIVPGAAGPDARTTPAQAGDNVPSP
jgi:signal transduction histidine kinase/DNA-binding NarL/FixJ family response regulator/HAMP domain-containing protein